VIRSHKSIDVKPRLSGLESSEGDERAKARLRRWALIILVFVLMGIPIFGWVQYRQAQNLERLTDQTFSGFEWDAFKLDLRLMSLRQALLQALAQPESSQLAAQASNEYNLFAAQVSLIDKGRTQVDILGQPVFQAVMAQAGAFLKLADPVLEDVQPKPDYRSMQMLFDQTDALQTQIYHLVIESHDLRSLKSNQMIKEVQSIDYYFAFLSAVAVMLGIGWGLSAMRNLTLSAQRQQELRALYQKSSFSASHDFLTGLANRSLLYDQLKHAIASSKRNGSYGAVILLDLDNFKPVNDTYGHQAGDMLLVEAASRMKKCVRDVDTVARFGGDEFAVLLGQIDGQLAHASDTAGMISKKLLDALSEPYLLTVPGKKAASGGVAHMCSASLGVAVFFKDTMTGDQIIQAADAAMYKAKHSGGNRVELAA